METFEESGWELLEEVREHEEEDEGQEHEDETEEDDAEGEGEGEGEEQDGEGEEQDDDETNWGRYYNGDGEIPQLSPQPSHVFLRMRMLTWTTIEFAAASANTTSACP